MGLPQKETAFALVAGLPGRLLELLRSLVVPAELLQERAEHRGQLRVGALALVEDGDTVAIDISHRSLRLDVPDDELARRRPALEADHGYRPASDRPRRISAALKAYAALAMSADKGAVRDVSRLYG